MMRCEDWPCCGHEAGDCDGSLYGSDESIKARVLEDIRNGHGDCDHEDGVFNCEDVGGEDEECSHENVRTFRSIPPHSKCLDCGQVVKQKWVTA